MIAAVPPGLSNVRGDRVPIYNYNLALKQDGGDGGGLGAIRMTGVLNFPPV